ncbi:MAG: sn-glycerol-1-phosphate dehydrogenase [Chitinispirillia bacterium]|jgi:glycerol-1-phosphate dehydrogenase [NAD(P)+]
MNLTDKIPESLDDLLKFKLVCTCGKTHSVDLLGISLRNNALDDIITYVRKIGNKLSIALIMDNITKFICGYRVNKLLNKDGHKTVQIVIPNNAGNKPYANEEGLKNAEMKLENIDLAIAVGCGTINDLTKLASFRKGIPYIVVVTAPSMNGFTSAIAAISINGIKRTIECHQPIAVIADLLILQNAPIQLISSGLGDLESKPTCTADFKLAGILRNEYYCSIPEQIVTRAEKKVSESVFGLKYRDPESIKILMEALLISGISMKMAGSSSPASGGEHLISHFWDMTADQEGRVEGYHGEQVGVATIVSSSLYEYLRNLLPQDIKISAIIKNRPNLQDLKQEITGYFGENAHLVSTEFLKKYYTNGQLEVELSYIRENWYDIWNKLDSNLRSSKQIRDTLKTAGCPVTVHELGLTPGHLRRSLFAARFIRNRFTVLDFASNLGILQEAGETVLINSGCLN